MLTVIKKYWYVFAILIVVAVLVHKNCPSCQAKFAAIKDGISPLNANTIV